MSDPRKVATEVLVIGGGVVGLAVAFELARAGKRVRLVERGPIGRGASQAAAGMLAPVSEAEFETDALLDFACDSLERYPAFVEEIERRSERSCGYRSDGTLWVAADRDGAEELHHLAALLEARRLAVQQLSPDEARAVEPHLGARVVECMRVAGDHQVAPRALCASLAAAIVAMGGELLEGLSIERVEGESGGLVAVGRAHGEPWRLPAKTVVVAAGAWSERDLSLPVAPLGVRPVKGQLLRLRGTPLIRHVMRAPDVYLVPRADGELLLGATMEEMGFDEAPTAGAAMDLLRHAWEVLPGVYDLELVEHAVGLRSAVDDHLPVVGESELPGLFFCYGHFRNGVLLAPGTAHYLTRWIVEGSAPAELAAFGPGRLAAEATR
jgi:glycine oxidase